MWSQPSLHLADSLGKKQVPGFNDHVVAYASHFKENVEVECIYSILAMLVFTLLQDLKSS